MRTSLRASCANRCSPSPSSAAPCSSPTRRRGRTNRNLVILQAQVRAALIAGFETRTGAQGDGGRHRADRARRRDRRIVAYGKRSRTGCTGRTPRSAAASSRRCEFASRARCRTRPTSNWSITTRTTSTATGRSRPLRFARCTSAATCRSSGNPRATPTRPAGHRPALQHGSELPQYGYSMLRGMLGQPVVEALSVAPLGKHELNEAT